MGSRSIFCERALSIFNLVFTLWHSASGITVNATRNMCPSPISETTEQEVIRSPCGMRLFYLEIELTTPADLSRPERHPSHSSQVTRSVVLTSNLTNCFSLPTLRESLPHRPTHSTPPDRLESILAHSSLQPLRQHLESLQFSLSGSKSASRDSQSPFLIPSSSTPLRHPGTSPPPPVPHFRFRRSTQSLSWKLAQLSGSRDAQSI